MAAAIGAGFVGPIPAADAGTSLTPVRVIGGPGHAQMYAWGQDTVPPGFPGAGDVLTSDYWNFRVQRFSPSGELRGTPITDDNRHGAPYDISVSPVTGDIAMADVDRGPTVDVYALDGTYQRSCGSSKLWGYPAWLDYDKQGRLAVADAGRDRVVVLDTNTCAVLFTFGSAGKALANLNDPRGVDFGPNGELWVSDAGNRRVVQWQVGAGKAWPVKSFLAGGGNNRGLLYNPDNDLVYVVNAGNFTVDAYTRAGVKRFSFGGEGTAPGLFVDGGRGITRDGNGDIWVGDMPTFRNQKFSATGELLFTIPATYSPPPEGGYNQPSGVAVDGDGRLYGVDTFNWRVNSHRPDGTTGPSFGDRHTLNYPRGIAVDRAQRSIIVGNTEFSRIEKYSPDGERLWWVSSISTFAVTVDQSTGRVYAADQTRDVVTVISRDGAVLSSFGQGQLANPRGVSVDPMDGSVWVANEDSGRIAHFDADGNVLGAFDSGAAQAMEIEVSADTIFLADKRAHVIRMYDKQGSAQGSFGGLGDGLGRFRFPHGLDLLGDRLFVMESGNERIQELRIGAAA